MKFVIPNYRTPDSFVDNVAYTLEKMGHDVKTMPKEKNSFIDNRINHLFTTLNSMANPVYRTKQEKWLDNELISSKFDVLLTLTQALPAELLFKSKQKGIINVTWWGDPPANMKKYGLLVKGWDKIYIKDDNASRKLKGLGFDAQLMHEAMNPDWHRPLYKSINDKVIVAGSFYDYRNFLVTEMLQKGVEFGLYGRKLPSWASDEVKQNHNKAFIVRDEKSLIFGEGLACLNSTSMAEANSLNCRAFEIAGAEGLQFFEYRSCIEQCFDLDKELKVFNSVDEALELVAWAKKHPKEALKVRQAGRQRALAEHTYEHRLLKIISDIS
jgi:spore maturation protein CgeB